MDPGVPVLGCLLSVLLLLASGQPAALVSAQSTRAAHQRRAVAGESSSSSSTSAGVQDGFTWHQPSSRNRRQQQQQQMQSVIRSPAGVFRRVSSQVYCSGDAASKQTCLFSNVCLVPTTNTNSSLPAQLTVVLSTPDDSRDGNRGAAVNRTVRLLKQHLGAILGGQHTYHGLTFITAAGELESSRTLSGDSSTAEQAIVRDLLLGDIASGSTSSVQVDEGVTILWRPVPHQQQSFGHALLNEAFPMFLVLSNHFGVGPADLPRQLQLLVSADNWRSPVLSHVLSDVITPNMMLLKDRLAQMHKQGKAGVCFRQLLLGDGGYIWTSRASLANSGKSEAQSYAAGPSFFSSRNWLAFRQYTMQVAGIVETPRVSRPLILLNDKRYRDGSSAAGPLKDDRRMILEIDKLAQDIAAAYPSAEVVVARFRDLPWPNQLKLLSQTSVFITTQGSSAFRWIWLPRGATTVVIGAPEGPEPTEWKSFHELDRWFPLSYVDFERYRIDSNNTADYVVSVKPGHWQPKDPKAAKLWWLYNADVRVRLDRLGPVIDQALGV